MSAPSYSNAVSNQRPAFNLSKKQNEKRPTKKQAVVLSTTNPNDIHNTPYHVFIRSVAAVVGATNIVAASKIPGSKFCIFFNSEELAKTFQSEHPTIQVNEIQFSVSLYLQPAAKLLLCNIWPFLPNSILEETLDNVLDRSIQFISPIKDVAMGFLDREYSNISFFKRYLFIQSEKEIRVPDHMFVTYEGNSYKIYLEIENRCKICNEPHSTNKCPNKQPAKRSELDTRLEQAKNSQSQQNIENPPSIIPLPAGNLGIGNKDIEAFLEKEYSMAVEDKEPNDENNTILISEENQNNPSQSIPKTPINQNSKRMIDFSPQASQPQTKKMLNEEEEQILTLLTDVLKNQPSISIEPQEVTRLWSDLKNCSNKTKVIQEHNLKTQDLYTIFKALSNHESAPNKYKKRAKKIASVLFSPDDTDVSDTGSSVS